jgi:predicted Zn-dependent protease
LHADLTARFRDALPAGPDHVSLRRIDKTSQVLSVRNDVVEPPHSARDVGVMITVHEGGGLGYAATPDMSASGLRSAMDRARRWARASARIAAFDVSQMNLPNPTGSWSSSVETPWKDIPLADRLGRLTSACAAAAVDARVVERKASVLCEDTDSLYLTAAGGEVHQRIVRLCPEVEVVAHANGETQRRTLGGLRGASRQGGAEVLDHFHFDVGARRVGEEAIALLEAPECPTGTMDLLISPDQMMLQIHESIGHPIELDRILGDERNYAGTSFVTLDMFGAYKYGSELLNVSFAPDVPGEFASYGWDDDGEPARRELLIDKGILMRPLGGTISQARAGLPGVANSRADNWNRPPIDRMANLNVEPGTSSFDSLVASIERGVLVQTNRSWSIDDSRNKFQFGVEFGRLIVDGQLGGVVKNANYRGISANFWRNLVGVGDRSTFGVFGTPYCGKGEPNQVISVGHASPACRFANISVFGGHS